MRGAPKHREITDRLRVFSRSMRHENTDAEAVLWSELRGRKLGGLKFRRQEIIGSYIVDFVCFEKKLIVEADGSQHGESKYDQKRDAELCSRGFEVVRFWNHEIFKELDDVCLHILKAAGAANP